MQLLWCVALAAVASQSIPPTPLHAASERGDVAEVRTLLAQTPASVDDLEDTYLRTPLMVAVTRRRESVTRLLLAANASLEMRDRDGQTALALASQAGLVQTVRLLLERGALVNGLANKGRSPLFYAAGSGNIEVVAELLKAGADPNLPSWTCETPLLVALQQSQHKVLPLLLNSSGIRTDVRRKMDALTAAELVEILKEGKALPPTLSHKRFLALPPPSGPAPCVTAEPWLDCAVGCNGPPPELVDMNFITFRRLAHHHAEKDVRRFVDLWERVVGAQPLQAPSPPPTSPPSASPHHVHPHQPHPHHHHHPRSPLVQTSHPPSPRLHPPGVLFALWRALDPTPRGGRGQREPRARAASPRRGVRRARAGAGPHAPAAGHPKPVRGAPRL